MKKLLLLMFVLLTVTNICLAQEKWEYIGKSEKNIEYYLDTSSIKTVQIDTSRYWQAKVKLVDPKKEFFAYSYTTLSVDINNKFWREEQVEDYSANGKLIRKMNNPSTEWNQKWGNIWDDVINKISELGSQKALR